MKTFKTVTIALAAMMLFAACGNAGAQNDKKNDNAPKAVKELNADSFTAQVFNMDAEDLVFLGDKPAIVDFTASWCGPCQRIAPILEELAKEYKGKIVIYKVDVDKCEDLARAFNISSIPALLFIPMEGQPEMIVGLRSKEAYKSDIEKKLLKK